jgi:hypothetical protein
MNMETNGHNGNEHRVSIVYDAPFWIALFESFWEGAYSVAREVIGTSEPTTSEIILFFERLDWQRLHYTVPTSEEGKRKYKTSFKKQQKLAQKALKSSDYKYVYSKAQEELKKQQEQDRKEKKAMERQRREADKERKFEIRQAKKKQKHKGR